MFTGIIEGLGRISQAMRSNQGMRLTVDADFDLVETKIGDSVAVNGACLTVVKLSGRRFQVDVSPETLEKTTFKSARVGERVNLERALKLSDRIDGHLVSGHIDGIGTIKGKENLGNAVIVTVETPPVLSYYMIQKGSVAVDGISLTINNCDDGGFDVSIIPHTAMITTIGFKDTGDKVNIETDLIGKYVERFVSKKKPEEKHGQSKSAIDKDFLLKTGFL